MADPIKKIGFFGGSFDPIHFGHLNLAMEILEKKELDEIWFSPAFTSPFRVDAPPSYALHRLEMVRLALEDFPFFSCHGGELAIPAPSFMIDAIEKVQEQHPTYSFFLIVGEDSMPTFHLWKESAALITKVPILIGCRKGVDILARLEEFNLPTSIKGVIKSGMVETKVMEISSTNIRERIKKRLNCHHLMPGKVLDYIIENQLYF